MCRHMLEGAAKSLFAYTSSLQYKAFVGWRQTAASEGAVRLKAAQALFRCG